MMSAIDAGTGTDVAMESADVVLLKSDPYDIVAAIELSHATLRKMAVDPHTSPRRRAQQRRVLIYRNAAPYQY